MILNVGYCHHFLLGREEPKGSETYLGAPLHYLELVVRCSAPSRSSLLSSLNTALAFCGKTHRHPSYVLNPISKASNGNREGLKPECRADEVWLIYPPPASPLSTSPGQTNRSYPTYTLSTMEDEGSGPAVKVYYLVAKKFKHIDIKRKQMFQGKMFDTK